MNMSTRFSAAFHKACLEVGTTATDLAALWESKAMGDKTWLVYMHEEDARDLYVEKYSSMISFDQFSTTAFNIRLDPALPRGKIVFDFEPIKEFLP